MVNAVGTLASMTGYATRTGAVDGLAWTWELRSVNARGLDVRLRMPEGCGAIEAGLRKDIGAALARGAVTLGLRLTRDIGAAATRIDPDRLATALDQIAQVEAAASSAGVTLAQTYAAAVLNLRVMSDTGAADDSLPLDAIKADAGPLIAALVEMRQAEGAAIGAVLASQIDAIANLTEAATAAAAARAEPQAARLKAALAAIGDVADGVDEARIAQELAMIAVKSDVVEELDRLTAHIAAARDLLAKGGPVGRKLDFLMQEFNREANTLCSKSGDPVLTAIGLDLKLAIDQMREQVQNLE